MICKHLPVKKISSYHSPAGELTQPITREELVREIEKLQERAYLDIDMHNQLFILKEKLRK